MKFDYVIVGAGIAGLCMAERITNVLHKEVLIIEKRSHIGGNLYDCYDENGLLIQAYGPHIFHTNDASVFSYLSTFTTWHEYQHKVLSYVNGEYVPFPVNLCTLSQIFHEPFTKEKAQQYFQKVQQDPQSCKTFEDIAIASVGADLYEMFYKHYTEKQWGMPCKELDASIFSRIPIRLNNDQRYFSDRYQGIPKAGFTAMMKRMLNAKMHILLNTDYQQIKDEISYEKLIYTGPLDAYYDYCYGHLPYRCLRFAFETHDTPSYQQAAVINYPNDYDYTRITEFKKLTGQEHKHTVILKEFPVQEGIQCYPILQPKINAILAQYQRLAEQEKDVIFLGRLANFKFYNIDQIVAEACKCFAQLCEKSDA